MHQVAVRAVQFQYVDADTQRPAGPPCTNASRMRSMPGFSSTAGIILVSSKTSADGAAVCHGASSGAQARPTMPGQPRRRFASPHAPTACPTASPGVKRWHASTMRLIAASCSSFHKTEGNYG